MREIKIVIEGDTPLLMNNIAGANLDGKGLRNPTEEQQLIGKLYWTTGQKSLAIPARAMHGCLLKASEKISVVIGGKKSKLSVLFGPCVHIGPDEMIPLGLKKYDSDIRSGVNPKTKGRVMIIRPRIENWKLTFTMTFDEEWIPVATLQRNIVDLLNIAGQLVGVLDFRPQRKGSFGTFHTVSVELLPATKQVPKEGPQIIGFGECQPEKKAA